MDRWIGRKGTMEKLSQVAINHSGVKLIDQIMIYRIYEKYLRDPFYSLYTAFRKNLFKEDIVIVDIPLEIHPLTMHC